MRILLADNNRLFIDAASEALAQDGHELVIALDGLEALEHLQCGRPDCCILDILMPRLNGDRLCAYIKADPDLRTIPVILVTGLAGDVVLNGGSRLADAVLAKGPLPALLDNLRALVRRAAAGELLHPEGCQVVGTKDLHPREVVGELVATKRHYEALLEHLGEGVIEVDPLGRVLAVNRCAAEFLGVAEHDLLGRWVGHCFESPTRGRFQQAFRHVAGPEGCPSAELAIDRHGRAVQVQIHRVPGEQGDFAVVLTFRDITPVVQGERARAVADLAAGVAHDFNNILGAILWRAEMLGMQHDAPEVRRHLDVIIKAAGDGGALARRLLGVAHRRDAEGLAPCDLNQIAQDALEFTRPRWKDEADRRGVAIEVTTDLRADGTVLGDAGELREVLTNVILNALDAMPKGGRLRVRTERRGGDAVVAVSDTGMGMAPEVRENLFRPYFTTKGPGGTGLGMSIAIAIIERHHGRIEVESAPGQGTTIRLALPVHGEALPPAPASLPLGRAGTPCAILLADDDQVVREVLAEALRARGHRVAEARDGQEAMAALEEHPFDLLVTDLGMPGIPGSELARRAKGERKVGAVALITGWGVDGDDRTLHEVGVDLVLNKPFDLADAMTQLEALAPR